MQHSERETHGRASLLCGQVPRALDKFQQVGAFYPLFFLKYHMLFIRIRITYLEFEAMLLAYKA